MSPAKVNQVLVDAGVLVRCENKKGYYWPEFGDVLGTHSNHLGRQEKEHSTYRTRVTFSRAGVRYVDGLITRQAALAASKPDFPSWELELGAKYGVDLADITFEELEDALSRVKVDGTRTYLEMELLKEMHTESYGVNNPHRLTPSTVKFVKSVFADPAAPLDILYRYLHNIMQGNVSVVTPIDDEDLIHALTDVSYRQELPLDNIQR